jgi:hypothetical protein
MANSFFIIINSAGSIISISGLTLIKKAFQQT